MYQYPTQANFSELKNSNKKILNQILVCFMITIIILIILMIIILDIKVYKINGSSMYPTLKEKEYVLTYQKKDYERKDIIAYHHNKVIMIKRIIGLPGENIDIKEDGTVFINGQELKEKYVLSSSLGEPDIKFPYTVPNNTYFVLGDNREDSLDSREVAIGCIKKEEIVGVVNYSIIPLKKLD